MIAFVYINTNPRYQLTNSLLASQLAVSSMDCPFLSHDSFIDCATLREKPKREVELLLKKDCNVFKGIVPAPIFRQMMTLIRHADSIERQQKRKYGLIQ